MIADLETLLGQLSAIEINTDVYTLTTDRQGYANLRIKLYDSEWLLHSGYDAVKEGKAFARKHYGDGALIVLGLGFGYHIGPLLSLLVPGQRIYIFETDQQVLKLSLDNTNISQCLHDERVCFFTGSDMKSVLKPLVDCLRIQDRNIIIYEPALRARQNDLIIISNALKLREIIDAPVIFPDMAKVRSLVGNITPLRKPVRVAFFSFLTEMAKPYRYFADNLTIGFEWLGCSVDFLTKQDLFDAVADPVNLPWDFFITFNTMLCNVESGGSSFYDVSGVTLFTISIDRPYHFKMSRYGDPKNIIYTWTNKDDLQYSDRFYFTSGRHVFLAHGAGMNFELANALRQERLIDVLVTCNLSDEDPFAELEDEFSQKGYAAVGKIVDYAVTHMDETVEECIIGWFMSQGLVCDDGMLESIMHSVGFTIDGCRRELKKTRIIGSMLDAGIEVHCAGANWHTADFYDHPLFICHGIVDFDVCRELIGRAKILVNIIPSNFNGSHERIFDSMIRGTLCVTEGGEYLRELFTDGGDVVFFDYENLPALAEKIEFYLDDDLERTKITSAAFDKVRNGHTWAHRAKEIVELWRNEQ